MSDSPPGKQPTYGSGARLAQIVYWLQFNPIGINLADLLERLNVSERTLYRYLKLLKEIHDDEGEPIVEVVRFREHHSRLRFRRKQQAIEGSAYELLSMYLALDLMTFLDGTMFHMGAQEFLDRLQQTISKQAGHQANLVMKDFKRKFYHQSEAPKLYNAHNQIIEKLVKALVSQRYITIAYQTRAKPAKKHRLQPLSLLMYKRALYLVGRKDQDFGGPEVKDLTFAVERINGVQIEEQTFSYPTDYDPGKRFQSSFGLVVESDPVMVRLRFDKVVAQSVASRRWHHSQQTHVFANGDLELSLCTVLGPELSAWVQSYLPYVKVLEPQTLKDELIARLEASLAKQRG